MYLGTMPINPDIRIVRCSDADRPMLSRLCPSWFRSHQPTTSWAAVREGEVLGAILLQYLDEGRVSFDLNTVSDDAIRFTAKLRGEILDRVDAEHAVGGLHVVAAHAAAREHLLVQGAVLRRVQLRQARRDSLVALAGVDERRSRAPVQGPPRHGALRPTIQRLPPHLARRQPPPLVVVSLTLGLALPLAPPAAIGHLARADSLRRAACTRTHSPTPPSARPLARCGAVGAGLRFSAEIRPHNCRGPPYAEPGHAAEPACLDSLWQAPDAPLLPRDRAPLAGASRCIVHERCIILQRQQWLRQSAQTLIGELNSTLGASKREK